MNWMVRCRVADNVTWLDDETARFQFHMPHELLSEASLMNIDCDVSLCRRGSHDTAAGALPQVSTLAHLFVAAAQ